MTLQKIFAEVKRQSNLDEQLVVELFANCVNEEEEEKTPRQNREATKIFQSVLRKVHNILPSATLKVVKPDFIGKNHVVGYIMDAGKKVMLLNAYDKSCVLFSKKRADADQLYGILNQDRWHIDEA